MSVPTSNSNMFAAYAPRARASASASAEIGTAPLPDGLEIAPATADDVDGVARLLAWREGISLAQATEHVRQSLDIPGENLFLAARIAATVVGFGRVLFVPAMPPPHVHVPQGWYLIGLVIDPPHRRRGIGSALVRARLAWTAQHARDAYYFANSTNRATIDLHERFGFREIARDFTFPRVNFTGGGGVGLLFRAEL